MFNIVKKSVKFGNNTLTIETGEIGRQADGAVMVSYGDTVVFVTAVGNKNAKEGQDFFPLTVDYQEKNYAAGKIPGGFFKREGRPSEKETLTCRLIDRPLRPLFPKNFYNEVQIVATVMSSDSEIDSDIPSIVGASAALAISGIPFYGRTSWGEGWVLYSDAVKLRPNLPAAQDTIHHDKDDGQGVKIYGFNGTQTVAQKVAQAKKEGLAGVMFWQLGGDVEATHAKSLLKTIAQ